MPEWYSDDDLKCFGKTGTNVKIDKTVQIIAPQNIYLGDNVRIDAFCILSATKGIEIGSQVHIAPYCQLVASGDKIVMEDFCGLSSRISIFTASDDYVDGSLTNPTIPDQFKKLKIGPVVLRKHTIVGCGSVIMPGCTLEFGSSVGTLAFVNKNVASGDIVVGVPAKPISKRNLNKLTEMEKEYLRQITLSHQ